MAWEMLDKYVIVKENCLDIESIKYLRNKITSSGFFHILSEGRVPLICKTDYSYYQSKLLIHEEKEIITQIVELINSAKSRTNKMTEENNLNGPSKISAKFFRKDSFYGLHFESPGFFGEFFFVLYLNSCSGGELVFPAEKTVDQEKMSGNIDLNEWNAGVKHLNSLGYSPVYALTDLVVRPQENTAIIAEIPVVHKVNPIIAEAPCMHERLVVNAFI